MLSPIQKQKLTALYPDLRDWLEQKETNDILKGLFSSISMVKGDKGDKGEDGKTPVKGKDYLTEQELQKVIPYILKLATPIKGKHYFDGKPGENGKSIKGERGADGVGKDGKDGSPDSPKDIALKLNTLKESVDVSVIKGAVAKKDLESNTKKIEDGMAKIDGRIKLVDQRWHGGGLSKVSTDSTLTGNGTPSSPLSVVGGGGSGFQLPLTGSVDGNNQTYTWATAPTVIVVDNQRVMAKTSASEEVNWTGTTTTVLEIAPNSDVFAII